MTKQFVLEIGTEEIPAKFMRNTLAQMREAAESLLQEENLTAAGIETFATPRRLVLSISDLAEEQAATTEVKRGPAVGIAFKEDGTPSPALQGFARSQGVAPEDLTERDGYMYAEVRRGGKDVREILAVRLPQLIQALQFPKSMRWGTESMRFARPIRWLVALYGAEVIPFELAGVQSGRTTRGHRFLGHEAKEIATAEAYRTVMADEFVMVDQEERRNLIRAELGRVAAAQGGMVVHDEELLEEVVHLVEYPTVLCGGFEDRYLQLPEAAVITPMKDHQRYFPIRAAAGRLLPLFLTVRNGGTEFLDLVRTGNERVLRARLADAEFFFNEDRKQTLAARYDALPRIVFQEGLGTMQDKTLRLESLTAVLAETWGASAAERETVARAAHLAKTDLTTAMVTEFTELQGEIGREYALLDGESEVVAQAVYEQYLPRFAGDELPVTLPGTLLSLADKLDNLAATFSQGHIPTGSQDPFALRRQAIGIVQTSLQQQRHWDLQAALQAACEALGVEAAVVPQVADFIAQRLRGVLAAEGLPHDVLDAVFALPVTDLYGTCLRAQALTETGFFADENLRRALVRVLNLAKDASAAEVREDLLQEEAERTLYRALLAVEADVSAAYAAYDLAKVYAGLQTLAAPIHQFFDAVIVMADDAAVRDNRLHLLGRIAALIRPWGDIKQLVD
ncbi:MAG: glycine--tRNA ligase subunit beta [Veillonellaceae bacterium]|nr:glycine--tRNA ligase subunit beta [Veillonellaceae bacterium]